MLKTTDAIASVVLKTERDLEVLWNMNVVCLFRVWLTNSTYPSKGKLGTMVIFLSGYVSNEDPHSIVIFC